MKERPEKLSDRATMAVLRLLLMLARPLPHRFQLTLGAFAGRSALLASKSMQKRVAENLARVYPNQSAHERSELAKEMARQVGRTLIEIVLPQQFLARAKTIKVTGPGLAALTSAKAQGKGAIVVSGHFGQWEAIRAVLLREGIECGAVYRPFNNRAFDGMFRRRIKNYGTPIAPKGRSGTRQLIKALGNDQVMAILLDQKTWDGDPVEFLGHPALTSRTPAELAQRYGIPVIPAYGIRDLDDPTRVDVVFEAPIEAASPHDMTRALNASLEKQVLARPDLWFWLHRRWGGRPARYEKNQVSSNGPR